MALSFSKGFVHRVRKAGNISIFEPWQFMAIDCYGMNIEAYIRQCIFSVNSHILPVLNRNEQRVESQ